MSSTLSLVHALFLIILQLFETVIDAQSSEQIYTFDFETTNGWTTGGKGAFISTATNLCPSGGKCWYMGKGGIAYGYKTYSVIGYQTIRVFIDIRNWDNEPSEFCNVRYQTGISGGWQTLYDFPGNNAEQLRTDIELSLPDTVDNRTDFQIQMYSSHSDNLDWCMYDNLEIWGIPINTATNDPSKVPTTAPITTTQPTTAPSTDAPTTANPTTFSPTTSRPTTNNPTTTMPTTFLPTTAMPTTAFPTTSMPTTSLPTSSSQVTVNPTTNAPSTAIPTTSSPTTYGLQISSTQKENGGEAVESTESENANKESGNEQQETSDKTWLYIIIGVVCLLVIIIIFICIYIKHRKNVDKDDMVNLKESVGDKTSQIQLEVTNYNNTTTMNDTEANTGVKIGEFEEGDNEDTNDDDGLYILPYNEHETAGEDVNNHMTAGLNEDNQNITKGNETIGHGANTNDLNDEESDDGDLYGNNHVTIN